MRWAWLIGSLALALLLAVLTLQTPAPVPASAPADQFSAERAMSDIRRIARAPHPVGSAEHARVQAYLLQRMQAAGLQTTTQTSSLGEEGAERFQRLNEADASAQPVVNLIGVLPGRDPALPAVALMAHYDTVPNSPGAADDSAGVAAILETVRAVRARGPADRDLVVLLTDAEELGLDGARAFWSQHPLRDRIGSVINLEARGGGGRASMFETGRGNAETVEMFARVAPRATGGVTASSLSVFVYELMPNSTDFTLPKDRGVQGLNFAFTGRAGQYHTPASTPDNLDVGSVQHLGAQALEVADALVRAPALPAAGENLVYADLLSRLVIAYPPAIGWVVWGLTAVLLAFAVWRARRRGGLTFADLGRGALDGVWVLTTGVVVAQAVRLLGGPQATTAQAYYTLMARLPWLEAGVALALLALVLVVVVGRARLGRWGVAGGVALAAVVSLGLGGFNMMILAPAVVSLALSAFPSLSARSTWGGWSGLIALVLLLGLVAQILAPTTAHLLVWPALLAAASAAIATLVQPALTRPATLAAPALAMVFGGAWLIGFGHFLFLGVGIDFPGATALLALLVVMLARPLAPETRSVPPLAASVALLLTAGALTSAAARLVASTWIPST